MVQYLENLIELAGRRAVDGTVAEISNGDKWTFVSASTDADDGEFVIEPTVGSGAGRWIRNIDVDNQLTISQLRAVTSPSTTSLYYISDSNKQGFFKYDSSDTTSDDDGVLTIVNGSKRYKRVFDREIYVDWWGAVGDGTTNDAAAFQAMFDWIGENASRSYKIKAKKSVYLINTTVDLPKELTGTGGFQPFIELDLPGVTLKTSSGAIVVFRRLPVDGDDIAAIAASWKPIFKGISFEGNNVAGSKGVAIGATVGAIFENCSFTKFDIGLESRFSVKGVYKNLHFIDNQITGLYCASGESWNQTIEESAFSYNLIESCKFDGLEGADSNISLLGTDHTTISNCVFEGAKPDYQIYADYQAAATSNSLIIEDCAFKTTGDAATLFYLKTSGQTVIANIQALAEDDVFFEIPTSSASDAIYIIENILSVDGLATVPFNGSSNALTGRAFKFKNWGTGSTTIAPLATSSWTGGVVPTSVEVTGEKSDGGTIIASTSEIQLAPTYNATDKYVTTRGSLVFTADDTFRVGSSGSTQARPARIDVGTGGVRVDTSARFMWANTAGTPDLTIARQSAGTLAIYDNSSTLKDLLVGNITVNGTITNSALTTSLSGKQDTLVSGTSIKTINNISLLGSGNIDLEGGGGGTGDVVGPASSTDHALPRFDGTGGKTLQGSGIIVDDSDNITIPGTITNTALTSALAGKQATLVSGTNIKTINGTSLLGSGDIVISGSGGSWGTITGTLTDQTDLNTALGLKANAANAALTGTTTAQTVNMTGNLSVNAGSGTNTITLRDGIITKASGSAFSVNSGWNAAGFNSTLTSGAQYTATYDGSNNSSWTTSSIGITTIRSNGSSPEIKLNIAGTDALRAYNSGGIKVDIPNLIVSGTITNTTLTNSIAAKQDTLISGTSIKTINGNSLLGSGDVPIPTGIVTQFGEGEETVTANAVVRWSGTTGGQAKNSTVIIDDTGLMIAPSLRVSGLTGSGTRALIVDNNNTVASIPTEELDESDTFTKGIQAMGSPIKAQPLNANYYYQATSTSTGFPEGSLRFAAVYLGKATTLTGVIYQLATAGVYDGSGLNSKVGLFSYDTATGVLTRVAVSASNPSMFQGSTGLKQFPFTTTYDAQPGLYFIGLLWDAVGTATTSPVLTSVNGNALFQASLFFTNGVTFAMHINATDIGTSYNSNTLSPNGNRYWLALY